jgi:hypothetical protein
MKSLMRVLGGLLILVGCVWFFQGINLLPGSFMTGQVQWAWYGGVTALAGVALLAWSARIGKNQT